MVYQVKHGEHGDERWVTHLGNVTDHEAPWKQVNLSLFLGDFPLLVYGVLGVEVSGLGSRFDRRVEVLDWGLGFRVLIRFELRKHRGFNLQNLGNPEPKP